MDYDYLKYKKILIVDDEADLREMVTSILELYFRAGRFQNNQDCWNSSRSSENMQGLGA